MRWLIKTIRVFTSRSNAAVDRPQRRGPTKTLPRRDSRLESKSNAQGLQCWCAPSASYWRRGYRLNGRTPALAHREALVVEELPAFTLEDVTTTEMVHSIRP